MSKDIDKTQKLSRALQNSSIIKVVRKIEGAIDASLRLLSPFVFVDDDDDAPPLSRH